MNTYNFNVTQNSNFTVFAYAQNSDSTYINLSGYNITGIVKFQYSSDNVLFNLVPSIRSAISGLVAISGNVQDDVPCGQYPYNIRVFAEDYSLNILGGYFNVNPSAV